MPARPSPKIRIFLLHAAITHRKRSTPAMLTSRVRAIATWSIRLSIPVYEVFALRYGTRAAMSSSHFLGGDPHDVPMPMDYYVWVARSADQTFVIDTGMTQEDAVQRKRTFLNCPIDMLSELDI